jgi:hypothetical protein
MGHSTVEAGSHLWKAGPWATSSWEGTRCETSRVYVGITYLRYRRSAVFPGHPLSLASQAPAQLQYSLDEPNTYDKKKQGRNRVTLRHRSAM